MLPFSKKKKKIFFSNFEKFGKIGGKSGFWGEKVDFSSEKMTFSSEKNGKNRKIPENSGKKHYFGKKSVKIALFRRKIVVLCVQDLKTLL